MKVETVLRKAAKYGITFKQIGKNFHFLTIGDCEFEIYGTDEATLDWSKYSQVEDKWIGMFEGFPTMEEFFTDIKEAFIRNNYSDLDEVHDLLRELSSDISFVVSACFNIIMVTITDFMDSDLEDFIGDLKNHQLDFVCQVNEKAGTFVIQRTDLEKK